MGRSFGSSFRPTLPIIFALFHLMPRRCFLQILGAHFQSNSLKNQAAEIFSSPFALHESRCREHVEFPNATAMLERVHGSARE